ncbi:MAG TPA: NAD-dependent epimerase/dehydratase family protein [Nitrospiria bacterium]|nr:NAD-dependent epimerase/dehydratase family protein [Nitrospiria bacterium]
MKVLLTGATGFIGWEVLKRLLAQGDQVRVLVRPETLAQSDHGRELQKMEGVEVIPGALTDVKVLTDAVEGTEIVYHLAWQSKRGIAKGRSGDGEDIARINIETTSNLLKACAEHRIRRFIYTSTVAVYGSSSDMNKWPVNEEAPLEGSYGGEYSLNYIEPKRTIENMIRQTAKESGFEYVILRPSIVYGAGSPMSDRMVQQAMQGPNRRAGQGNQVGLQMVHVRDAAESVILAGKRPEAVGREFNIAGPEVASVDEMNRMLRAAMFRINRGMPLPGRFLGQLKGYQRYDTTKAEMILGFKSQITLPEGLAEMMAGGMGVPYTPSAIGRSAARIAQAYDFRLDFNLLNGFYDNSDFWDFGYWDAGTKNQREACENLVEKLLAYIPEKKGNILDVACGKGASTRLLLNYYKPENIIGINISEKQLEICRRNAPGVDFRLMNAVNLEFPNEHFDNVLCVEAAGHFDTRDMFLREAHRVLKPGGKLVLCDAIFTPRAQTPQERTQQEVNYVRNAEEFGEALKQAGFRDVIAVDTTRESWGGFSEHLRAYLDEGKQNGTLDDRNHAAVSSWLNRLETYFEFYVVASGTKK